MQNIKDYIKFLGLKKPVVIRLNTRTHKRWDGYYSPHYNDKGKLAEHRIMIYLEDTRRSFDTLLAHELIHAWQEENKVEEFHGEQFIRIARSMECQFGLCDVYVESADD